MINYNQVGILDRDVYNTLNKIYKYGLKLKGSLKVQKRRLGYLEGSLIWNNSLSDNAGWIMHSCACSLYPPTSSLPKLCQSDFTDESAWSWIGSTVFGFECKMRKAINLKTTIQHLFQPSFPLVCSLASLLSPQSDGEQGFGKLVYQIPPWEELCLLVLPGAADVASKENMLSLKFKWSNLEMRRIFPSTLLPAW